MDATMSRIFWIPAISFVAQSFELTRGWSLYFTVSEPQRKLWLYAMNKEENTLIVADTSTLRPLHPHAS